MTAALCQEPQETVARPLRAPIAPDEDDAVREADDQATKSASPEPKRRPFRLLWLAFGWVMFGVGFVGVFLPILPTTGFWILAALAFERSNPAIAKRIRNWPRFGRAVSLFLDHGVISRRGKAAALGAMMLSAVLIILLTEGVALWGGLGGIAIGALYVATRPSQPKAPASDEEREA